MKKIIDDKVSKKSYRKKSIKIISIFLVLLMVLSVATSTANASFIEKSEDDNENLDENNSEETPDNSGLLNGGFKNTKLGERLSSAKEKIKDFFNQDKKNDNEIEGSSRLLDGSSDHKLLGFLDDLLTFHTNYSGVETSTGLGLFQTVKVDVDGVGGDDVSARVTVLPGFDFKTLSFTINFNLNIELLSGSSINNKDFLESYASLNFPGFLLKNLDGKSIDFGYRSLQGEQIPSSCTVTYKLAPNLLNPVKKPTHIFEINPGSSKNDRLTLVLGLFEGELAFNFEKFVKGTVKLNDILGFNNRELSVQVDEQTSVDVQMNIKPLSTRGLGPLGFYIENLPKKSELVFKGSFKIIGGETLDVSYKRISADKANVIFYVSNGVVPYLAESLGIFSDLDYFYVKYLPKEFSFSLGLSVILLKGYVEFDTGGESVSQIGWFDDLFKPKECLYLSDFPTTGKINVNFNVIRKHKIHAYADKRLSLNGYFETIGMLGGESTTEFSIESNGILDVTIVFKLLTGYFEIKNNLDIERDIFIDVTSDYLYLSLEGRISRSSDQPFILDVGGILRGPINDAEAGVGVSISNGWDFSISKLVVEANEIPVYMTGLNGLVAGNRVVDFDLDVRNIDFSKTYSDDGELTVSFTPILPLRQSLMDRVDAAAFRVYVSKNCEFTIDSIDSDIVIKEVIVPTVNITYPKVDELETPVVSDIVTITGTAKPGEGGSSIDKVEVMIDNNGWKKVTGTEKWSYSCDTTVLDDGEHLIKARSYDGSRYSSLDVSSVIVANHVVPTVRIIMPSDGDIVDGTVSVEGTANSGIYTRLIEKVEVRVDKGSWMEANGDSYWDYTWDTSSVSNGEHVIEARSYDGYRYSVIDSVTVVKGQAQIPSVKISSPSDGSTVNGVISIKGSASPGSSSHPVESVELSIGNDEGWASASGTSSWTYNWDTSNLEPGTYLVRARSFDGNFHSPPDIITLNVEDEVENPVINITDPIDGSDVSDTVKINGTATAATQGRPINLVQIRINNGEWQDASGKEFWDFDWDSKTVCNGYYSVEARCIDSMGYEGTDIIYINVDNGPSFNPPSVRIDNPSLHAVVEDVVNVQGQAFKGYSGRSIEQVQLAMMPQNTFAGSLTEYSWKNVTNHNSDWSSWSYDWDTSEITAGAYLIVARCYDGEYYSNILPTKMELIGSGSGVLVAVKNFDFGDRTFKFEIHKEKSTYVNIGDFNVDLTIEKLPGDEGNNEPFEGSFSWSSLEIKSSNEPNSFEVELDFEDNSIDITRSKIGNELTIEDIHIEANNLDLSFLPIEGFDDVDSTIHIDKLVYDTNTPKDGGLFLQLNSQNGESGISLAGKIVLSSQLELFGLYIKVNEFSWNKPTLHLIGPKTYTFGLNVTVQNVSWNIAQDFSWGWIRVGPSGSAYMDIDFSKYEGDDLVFQVSGIFTFSSGDGIFNLSWNGLGTDDFTFNAEGSLLVDIQSATFIVRDIFALDIQKIKSNNAGANFTFDISQDDGTINWERTKQSTSDIDLEIDLELNVDKDNQIYPLPGDFNFVLQGDISKDSTGQTYGETTIEWIKGEYISVTIDRDVNRNLDFLMEDFLFSVGIETVFSVDLSCDRFQRTIDRGSGQRSFYFDYNTDDDELTVKFETENSPQLTIEFLDLEVYVAGVLHAATGVDYFHKDSGSSLLLEITSVNIMDIINGLQGQGITLDDISGDVCFTLESNAKITLDNFYIDGAVGVGTGSFDVSLAGEFHMDKNTGRSTRIYAFADFDEKTFDIVLENSHSSQKIMEITNLDFAVSATVSGITGGLTVSSNRVRSVTNSGAILLEIDGTMVSVNDLSGKFAFSGSISSASVTKLKVAAGVSGPNQNRVYMDGDFTFQNSGSTSTGFALVINSMSSGSLDFNFNHAHSGKTVIDNFTLGVVIPSVSLEVQIIRDYWEKTGSGSTFFDLSASLSGSTVNLDLIYQHQGSTEKLVQGLEVSVSVFGFGLKKYFDVTRMKSKSSYTLLEFSATGVNLNTFSFNKIELNWNHGTTKSLFEFNMALFDTTFNLKNGETSGTLYACVDRVQKYATIERSHSLDWDWFIIDTTIGGKNFNFRIENSRSFYGDLTFEWGGDLLGMKPTLMRLYTTNGVHGQYDFIRVMKNSEEIFNLIYGSHDLSQFEIKVYNIQYSSNGKLKHFDFHSEWDYASSCGSIRFLTEIEIETEFAGDLDAELSCEEGQGLSSIEEVYVTTPSGINGVFKINRNSGVNSFTVDGNIDAGSEVGYKKDSLTSYDHSQQLYLTGSLNLNVVRVKDSQLRCELTAADVDVNYLEVGMGSNPDCKWITSTGTNTITLLDLDLYLNSVDISFNALSLTLQDNFYAKKYDWTDKPGDSTIGEAGELRLDGQLTGSGHLEFTGSEGSFLNIVDVGGSININVDELRIGCGDDSNDANKEYTWFSSKSSSTVSAEITLLNWQLNGDFTVDGSVRFCQDSDWTYSGYEGESFSWTTSFAGNQGINQLYNANLQLIVSRNGKVFDFTVGGSVTLKLNSNAQGIVANGEDVGPNGKLWKGYYFDTNGQASIGEFSFKILIGQNGLGFRFGGTNFGADQYLSHMLKFGIWIPMGHDGNLVNSGEVTLETTFNGGASDDDWFNVIDEEGDDLDVDARDNAGNHYTGVVNQPLQFDGDVTGGTSPYTYYWDFGDGGSSDQIDPSHTYTETGTYTAELTVVDANGLSGSDTADVDIVDNDLEAILSGPSSAEEHETLEFSSEAIGGYGSYFYDIYFGDGDSFSQYMQTNPEIDYHSYVEPGDYTVTLNILDLATDETATDQYTITIYNDNDYSMSASLSGVDKGDTGVSYEFTVTVSGSDTESPYDYYFDFGDGNTETYTFQTNTKTVDHSYSSSGEYTITVDVVDGNLEECSASHIIDITDGYQNDPPVLSNPDVNPDPGDENSLFTYEVYYYDADGDYPQKKKIHIYDKPSNSWYDKNMYLPPGEDLQENYDGSVEGIYIYELDASYLSPGTGTDHQYAFTFNDGMAEHDDVDYPIPWANGPDLLMDALTADAGGPYEGNEGDSIQFYGSAEGGTGGYTYEWFFGDGGYSTQQNPSHTYNYHDQWTVELQVTDSNGNTDSDYTTAIIWDWVSPGSHEDTDWYLNSEGNARDGDTSTYTSYRKSHAGTTDELILKPSSGSMEISGFRIDAKNGDYLEKMILEFHYGSTEVKRISYFPSQWNHHAWTTNSFLDDWGGGSPVTVDRVEITFECSKSYSLHWAKVWEFEFGVT